MAETNPPKKPDVPPDHSIVPNELLEGLTKKIEALEAKLNPPDPNKPKPLPTYSKKPPAAGSKRIRIKSVRGQPVTPKVRVVDDTVDQSADTYRCHGFLHPREVVDVPAEHADVVKVLLDADLVEEVSAPSTRPLFYENEALCRMADPRRERSAEETQADIERAMVAQQKLEKERAEKAKAEAAKK